MKKLTTYLLPLLLSISPLNANSKERVSVAIQTPSSCEQIQITDIYSNANSAVIVAKVFKHSQQAMCMMMISNSSDSVLITQPLPKQTTIAIVGKSWCWKNPSESTGYTFINTQAQLDKLIEGKDKIYTSQLSKSAYYQGVNAGKNCN